MEQKTCEWCGNEYSARTYNQRFCRKECRIKWQTNEAATTGREKKREADRRSYQRRKEHIASQAVEYRRKNIAAIRERDNAYNANYRQELKAKIIARYGGACRRCGFDDSRALQIDHINGGGTKEHRERKTQFGFMRKVLLAEPNTEYQLLCANCNQIKRYENGEGVGKRRKPTNHPRKY